MISCVYCGHRNSTSELREYCGVWRCRNLGDCLVRMYCDNSIVILSRREREENG